jgi:hypothetical protein
MARTFTGESSSTTPPLRLRGARDRRLSESPRCGALLQRGSGLLAPGPDEFEPLDTGHTAGGRASGALESAGTVTEALRVIAGPNSEQGEPPGL